MKKIFLMSLIFTSLVGCQESTLTNNGSVSDRSVSLRAPDSMEIPGAISGQVLNLTDDSAIAGAIVTIKKGNQVISTAITNANGFFKVIGLPSQDYDVTAEAASFSRFSIASVPVRNGGEVVTHFILTPDTEEDHPFLSAMKVDVLKRKI
ncbi:MAG: carboxypeptidase-like regulatory domain-containing protein [Bacteriovoracia bacterium]